MSLRAEAFDAYALLHQELKFMELFRTLREHSVNIEETLVHKYMEKYHLLRIPYKILYVDFLRLWGEVRVVRLFV